MEASPATTCSTLILAASGKRLKRVIQSADSADLVCFAGIGVAPNQMLPPARIGDLDVGVPPNYRLLITDDEEHAPPGALLNPFSLLRLPMVPRRTLWLLPEPSRARRGCGGGSIKFKASLIFKRLLTASHEQF
jgi:hypothetical protein